MFAASFSVVLILLWEFHSLRTYTEKVSFPSWEFSQVVCESLLASFAWFLGIFLREIWATGDLTILSIWKPLTIRFNTQGKLVGVYKPDIHVRSRWIARANCTGKPVLCLKWKNLPFLYVHATFGGEVNKNSWNWSCKTVSEVIRLDACYLTYPLQVFKKK